MPKSKYKGKRLDYTEMYSHVSPEQMQGCDYGPRGAQPINPATGNPISRMGKEFHRNQYMSRFQLKLNPAGNTKGHNPGQTANLCRQRQEMRDTSDKSKAQIQRYKRQAHDILVNEFFRQVENNDRITHDNIIQLCGQELCKKAQSDVPWIQFRAIEMILNYAIGKPQQQVKHEGVATQVVINQLMNSRSPAEHNGRSQPNIIETVAIPRLNG